MPKALALALLSISAVFGVLSYTVDSEIWSVSLAHFFWQSDHVHFTVYNKPLFHLLLSVLYLFPLSSLGHLIAAKTLFVANSLLLSVLSFQVYGQVCKNPQSKAPWLGWLLLLSHPTWLAESFRIRADLLAMSCSLIALLEVLRSLHDNKPVFLSKPALWLLLSLLITPKALVWNLPLGIYFLLAAKPDRQNLKVLARGLALVGLITAGLCFFESFRTAYALAWTHFVTAFSESSFLSSAPWQLDWFFVRNSVRSAPFHWLLIVSAALMAPFMRLWQPPRQKRQLLGALGALFLFFCLYSPKLYYFWAASLPLLMIPVVLVLDHLMDRLSVRVHRLLLLIPTSFFIFWCWILFPAHEGLTTYQLVQDLEKLTSEKPVVIFDSMGLMVRGTNLMSFVGVGDPEGNQWTFKNVSAAPPDLILYTSRLQVFYPQLKSEILSQDYFEIHEDIWLKKTSSLKPPGPITEVQHVGHLFNQRLL